MAGGNSAPTDTTDTTSHINTEYDSDEDGVVEDSDAVGGYTPPLPLEALDTGNGDGVQFPTYATQSDVPALSKGKVVFVDSDSALYVEDGT